MSDDNADTVKVDVQEASKGFDYWLERFPPGSTVRSQLEEANLLIVPQEGFRERDDDLFPVGTEELLAFLKAEAPSDVTVDICSDGDSYKELAVHSALLDLGGYIVSHIVAPVVVVLLVRYLTKRVGPKTRSTAAKLSLTVESRRSPRSRAVEITYEGPAEEMEYHVSGVLAMLHTQGTFDGGPLPTALPSQLPPPGETEAES